MHELIAVKKLEDISPQYRNTPISRLLAYHNFGQEFDTYSSAELLVGMCMDNRKRLRIPENFAYIIRSGGANLRYSEFKVTYAIAVGGVKALALIGHNDCGMVNISARKELYINGLVENGGWDRSQAEEYFQSYAPMYEIGSESEFVLSEVNRLRLRFPKILVAPLIYRIEDNLLYLIQE